MARPRPLTEAAVERFNPPAIGQVELWDVAIPGFGIRATAKGQKSWVLMKRLRTGRKELVRFKLGDYPTLKLASARAKAGQYIDIINANGDPREETAKEIAAHEAKKRRTFEVVANSYVEKHCKRKIRSWSRVQRGLEMHVLPHWRNKPIAEITRSDVNELLDTLIETGLGVQANRILAYVRAMFNWCVERGILEASPATQIKPPVSEQPRERTLSDQEIARLWKAFDALGKPFATYLKLLLLLGQRRNEVACMRWQDIDFDKCAWTLPSERTKAKRSHVVPLPSAALELIKRLPRLSYSTDDSSPKIPSEYVFTTNGKSPISGFGWIKARIDSEVSEEMPLWTLHDLRRTVATGLVGLGIPVDHVARLLNHAKSGVTSRFYDQHSYFLEKRAALEAWEAHLLKIVS